ncbi:hypothetical protein B0H66DRAFT_569508 [Apodospora peruviana]|uniref:Uncharacterized protein n=1 Tax=Apodospora peruviana TaxID=516989 RepID=A0AAE0LYY4_9PEZI|nr:hypothetical protein B0H66DRAFT_569508 [Apodospora peruviana]
MIRRKFRWFLSKLLTKVKSMTPVFITSIDPTCQAFPSLPFTPSSLPSHHRDCVCITERTSVALGTHDGAKCGWWARG